MEDTWITVFVTLVGGAMLIMLGFAVWDGDPKSRPIRVVAIGLFAGGVLAIRIFN